MLLRSFNSSLEIVENGRFWHFKWIFNNMMKSCAWIYNFRCFCFFQSNFKNTKISFLIFRRITIWLRILIQNKYYFKASVTPTFCLFRLKNLRYPLQILNTGSTKQLNIVKMPIRAKIAKYKTRRGRNEGKAKRRRGWQECKGEGEGEGHWQRELKRDGDTHKDSKANDLLCCLCKNANEIGQQPKEEECAKGRATNRKRERDTEWNR